TGTITEPGGTISAPTLTCSAHLDATMDAASNAVDNLTDCNAGTPAVPADLPSADAKTLTASGVGARRNVSLNAPSLILAGAVTAGNQVSLTATTGTITEPGGTISAPTLTGSAHLDATMDAASNAVDNLTDFNAGTPADP